MTTVIITRMSSQTGYAYLTQALSDKNSMLRQHLDDRFPNHKGVFQRYRAEVGLLLVEPGEAPAGTLGSAFDWVSRFMLHPAPNLSLATAGANNTGSAPFVAAYFGVLKAIFATQTQIDPQVGAVSDHFEGASRALTVDKELLHRAAWVLALCTEIYRIGPFPGSALDSLLATEPSTDAMLALIPDDGLRQLREMQILAEKNLIPRIQLRTGPWRLGPTFDGSGLLRADADFVAGGILVDIKTGLGSKRSDGARYASLKREELWQIICYALMDFSDRYELTELGIYAARYGRMVTWRLQDLLDELHGRHVDLAEERQQMKDLLTMQQKGR